jgi:Protein of unknown function (DUF1553)/Protein of unknown function (DUF1549)
LVSGCLSVGLLLGSPSASLATPVNKAALAGHYGRFLATNLNSCTTCHFPAKLDHPPENLDEFPHNPFGIRLRQLGEELHAAGKKSDIPTRLAIIAGEDSDGDGVPNETELLLGHAPGDPADKPAPRELADLKERRMGFEKFQASYHWRPFEPVQRPPVPKVRNPKWVRNPIDALIATEHAARDLKPRPEASKEVLLRRIYLDLIGLAPTPDELKAFEKDNSANAYEKVVDRLLTDPRYGERWGRHWMDIWRYSDWAGWTDGGQVRDSKPHIWRWRDWIVESLNQDKGYDRMVVEMLAADELEPEDTDALRATGFLVRNFKLLSREAWLEDTLKHTSQAFLGVTMGCAKCHNHMFDPISQKEYYQMRAVFEPHQVRTDRIPGQPDTTKDGLVRAYDTETNGPTYFFVRGDERRPDTNQIMSPGVPRLLGGSLNIEPLQLPRLASLPDKREFAIRDTLAESEKLLAEARQKLDQFKTDAATKSKELKEQELNVSVAEMRHAALLATLRVERLEDNGNKGSEEWKRSAIEAMSAQRQLAMIEARLKFYQAQSAQAAARIKADEAAKAVESDEQNTGPAATEKERADKVVVQKKSAEKATKDLEAATKKTEEAEKTLASADKELAAEPTTAYKPRPIEKFPAVSTGRRLAFARWIANHENPLTARVAMNHIWLRHFGQALVPSVTDFGANGRPPTNPQLLDWLAAEFMAHNWSMKKMHRLMVTSSAYRMASTPDESNAKIDPDNLYLWRMNSRRMEAEVVRDNVLYVSGQLDPAMGGPEVDHKKGLDSTRRSVYLRIAAEKEVEFLKIFDSPNVTECYERKPSVMPQQSLALANSRLTLDKSRLLARALGGETGNDDRKFATSAFLKILSRHPTQSEVDLCVDFLEKDANRPVAQGQNSQTVADKSPASDVVQVDPVVRARENLVLVLFNHNDFVAIR